MKKSYFILCAAIILILLPVYSFGKNILVIESYHSENQWNISYRKGLENRLMGKHQIRYFQMDTKRLPESEYKNRANLAWAEYLATKPDLVILTDDNALKFLGPRFLKTKVPVVYLGISANPRNYNTPGTNITGILERPLLKRSIIYLKEILKPAAEKILVLFDSGTTSSVLIDKEFYGKPTLKFASVTADLKSDHKFEVWKSHLKNAKKDGYDAVVLGLYHTMVENNGEHVEAETALEWANSNSPLPMFGFWDFSVGAGKTIGGYVLFGEPQGEEAGEIVEKIFQGIPPGEISPYTAAKGKLLFSRSQLKKWGIKLPSNIISKAEFVD